jgi:hypothetical protein
MKKLIGCLVMIMLAFAACEGPMGPAGRDGWDGKDGAETKWWIKDFTIVKENPKKDEWQWQLVGEPNDIGSYFYCICDVPEITRDIYNDGAIIAYYRYVDDFGDEVQTVLPYTYYDIVVDNNDNEFPYCVQYSYDTTVASIAFKLVFSDFYTKEYGPPANCKFRLVLIY